VKYGFRKNRTTAHALMETVEGITKAVDDDEYFIDIYIDLQKAFDTIDQSIIEEIGEVWDKRDRSLLVEKLLGK